MRGGSSSWQAFAQCSEMRAAWKPEQRLGDMDLDGVEAAVLFGGGPLGSSNSELYIASF